MTRAVGFDRPVVHVFVTRHAAHEEQHQAQHPQRAALARRAEARRVGRRLSRPANASNPLGHREYSTNVSNLLA